MKRILPIAAALIALAALSRLVPHPANFTATGAASLFAGFYFPRKRVMPFMLVALFLSDAVLGFYDPRLMLAVYGGFLVMGLWGAWAKRGFSSARAFLALLAGSFSFYLITNFAVWFLSSWYPHTTAGLIACYAAAIPFFRASLAGDLFYGGALFAAHALAVRARAIPVSC